MSKTVESRFRINFTKSLTQEYFLRKTEDVAKSLIGKYLVRIKDGIILVAKIVETEAYLSTGDESSHSARGITARNKVMFEKGGVIYVYKIYGMHYCTNIICEYKGKGCGVLLRAAQPILGLEKMAENRGSCNIRTLCKGPGNLSKAFGFTLQDYGSSACSKDLFIQNEGDISEDEILTTPRIGIKKSAKLPLRFILRSSQFVSGKKIQDAL